MNSAGRRPGQLHYMAASTAGVRRQPGRGHVERQGKAMTWAATGARRQPGRQSFLVLETKAMKHMHVPYIGGGVQIHIQVFFLKMLI